MYHQVSGLVMACAESHSWINNDIVLNFWSIAVERGANKTLVIDNNGFEIGFPYFVPVLILNSFSTPAYFNLIGNKNIFSKIVKRFYKIGFLDVGKKTGIVFSKTFKALFCELSNNYLDYLS